MSELDIDITNIFKDIEYELNFINTKHKKFVIDELIKRLKVLSIQAENFDKIIDKHKK